MWGIQLKPIERQRVYRSPVTGTYCRLTGKVIEAPKSGRAVKSQITRRKSACVYESAGLGFKLTHRRKFKLTHCQYFWGLAFPLGEAYEGGMLTEGGKTPPGKQRLVGKSHRSCGAHRWQRPADAATAFTTIT